MKPAYMPFTYLSAPTAHILKSLFGPLYLFQPSKTNIPENISALASQDLVEIRTPLTDDDDRLQAALAEFKAWALANPGRSTAGAGFIGTRQGEVPFYDETAISRIRTDLKRYPATDNPSNESQTGFSARLFLAVAQENDQASDNLDQNLNQFKTLEKSFLETLHGDDAVGFNRQSAGGTIWQDDPGARMTTQRIRAWARLASADPSPPALLVTTSTAVMDTIIDLYGETIGIEKSAVIRMAVPNVNEPPALSAVLTELCSIDRLAPEALSAFMSLGVDAETQSSVAVTLYIAEKRSNEAAIRSLAAEPGEAIELEKTAEHLRHTLIVLVEN